MLALVSSPRVGRQRDFSGERLSGYDAHLLQLGCCDELVDGSEGTVRYI